MNLNTLFGVAIIVSLSSACASNMPATYNQYNNIEKAQYHVSQARRYMEYKQWEDAQKEFMKAAEYDPSDYKIWGNAGNAASRASDFKTATYCFHKVLEIQPDDFRAYGSLGKINGMQRKYIEAIEYFSKAFELNASDYWTAAYLAKVHFEIQDYKNCAYYMDIFEGMLSDINSSLLSEKTKRGVEKVRVDFATYRAKIAIKAIKGGRTKSTN